MKIRCEALKRGTRVSPSTGQQVHLDPDATRYSLARAPLIDERDVDYFVDEGFIDEPAADAERIGLEREREIYEAEARGGVSRKRGNRDRQRNKRRTSGRDRGAERAARAAPADSRAGDVNSGVETRQVRNNAPNDDPGREMDEDAGDEGDAGAGEGGLSLRDPASPPVARPRRGTGAAKPAGAAAAKPAAAKGGGRKKAGA